MSAHAASVIATVPMGPQPHGVAVNPKTGLVYVANYGGGTGSLVSVIDSVTNTVMTSIVVGAGPFGVGVNPATNRVYVSNHAANTVSVIDAQPGSPSFHTVIATIAVGNEPEEFGVNPLTNRIYVSNFNGGAASAVSVIDGGTNSLLTSILVGSGPDGVAVDPVSNRAWVANFGSGTISVIDGATQTVVNTIPGLDHPERPGVRRAHEPAVRLAPHHEPARGPRRGQQRDARDGARQREPGRRGAGRLRQPRLRGEQRPRQRLRDRHDAPPGARDGGARERPARGELQSGRRADCTSQTPGPTPCRSSRIPPAAATSVRPRPAGCSR